MNHSAKISSEKPWLWWVFAAAFAFVPVFLLLIPLPIGGRVGPALGNMCHGPLFACLTIIGVWLWNARSPTKGRTRVWRAIIAAIILTCAGATMEFVQAFFGRTPSVHDGLANACGCFAGMSGFLALGSNTKLKHVLGVIVMLGLIGWTWKAPLASLFDHFMNSRQWPIIDSFERAAGLERWYTAQHEISRRRGVAGVTNGQYASQIDFKEGDRSWVTLYEFRSDWSDFDTFQIDITELPNSDSASIAIQLVSRTHTKDELAVIRKEFDLPIDGPKTLEIRYQGNENDEPNNVNPRFRAEMIRYIDIDWISDFPGSVVLDNLRLSSSNISK